MNRREVLTGMALASAAVAVPATVVAKGLPASRAAWDRAMATFRRLHDEHEAACVAQGAVEERYYAERPAQPLGAEFKIGDTVDTYHARLQHDREHFERLDAECRERTGFEASEARQGLACDASWEALGALLATPAPGLAEVAQKIELATEYGRRIEDLDPVIADLRRLEAVRA